MSSSTEPNISFKRNDSELPVLWDLTIVAFNGDKIYLPLNQDEMEQLQDGVGDLLHHNAETFELEVS